MGTCIVFANPRPVLTVETTGGRSLGRCYSETTFRVTTLQPLARRDMEALGSIGVLGVGQELSFSFQTASGAAEPLPESTDWPFVGVPTGYDTLRGAEADDVTYHPTGRALENPPTAQRGYYVYNVVRRCDSSD